MKYIAAFIFTFLGYVLNGQVISDMLRYSYHEDFSTARSLAISNALAPLGGDFYTLSDNPAGLATYRYSEFTLSTGFRNWNALSQLEDFSAVSEEKNDIVLNNLGFVSVHKVRGSNWELVNFGVGYNRNTSYDRRSFYQGSTLGSITDRWLERAQGHFLSDLLDYEAGLAYDAGAIYNLSYDNQGNPIDDGRYISDYQRGVQLPKSEQTASSGGLGELAISLAGNYNNKLQLGMTLGIPLLRYNMERTYREEWDLARDSTSLFRALSYHEALNSDGTGVNLKLGMIYRITQDLRWSLHLETGSRISVVDEYTNDLTYSYVQNGTVNTLESRYPPSDEGALNFKYTMVTPYTLSTGVAIVLGKNGFLSTGIDFTDYTAAKFEFDEDVSSAEDLAYERELNHAIDSTFHSAFTFRVGGELALEGLRLRAGGVLKQRPFSDDQGFDFGYSTGIGFRINHIFIDFAYRRFVEKSTYSPYPIANTDLYEVQQVKTQDVKNDFLLTFGVKF